VAAVGAIGAAENSSDGFIAPTENTENPIVLEQVDPFVAASHVATVAEANVVALDSVAVAVHPSTLLQEVNLVNDTAISPQHIPTDLSVAQPVQPVSIFDAEPSVGPPLPHMLFAATIN
jgi:hypothetical protein